MSEFYYNKQAVIRNQKEQLKSQLHCGYPDIERQARKTLTEMERYERQLQDFDKRVRVITTDLSARRAKKEYNTFKKQRQNQNKNQKKKRG